MILDLSNPIVIGVSVTIIPATIFGIIHYVKTLVQLNFTDKKLSNVLSELDALHKDYKKEITDIKKRYAKDTEFIAKIFEIDDSFNKLREHSKPPVRGGWASLFQNYYKK